ncbi:MAG: 3-phosphoserine/phosphohydroxythreonine transaminase [Aquisalimonadaceae bacterium]
MSRVFNFSAGPGALPEPVLRQAAEEMLDWQGSGMSVMEMSHRGKEFMSIAAEAEANLRKLLAVPDNYRVLFMQGGATGMFSAIPMNLMTKRAKADYVNTGSWSKKATKEAKQYGEINIAAASPEDRLTIPARDTWTLSEDAAYLHYCPNETITGVEFHWVPEVDVPLVADMSSTILSRPVDVSRFGLIYAGAQKNMGPAGMTLVIVRDDLIGDTLPGTPGVWNFKTQADADSMSNTPPTFAWYIAGLVYKWILAQGGLEGMGERNRRKAETLYDAVDASAFYSNPVDTACRSWMNVPFILADSGLDKTFLAEAGEQGLVTLGGHRSVGGMRASLYNAMPQEGVDRLVEFMADFERRHG